MPDNDLIRRGDLVNALMMFTWRDEEGRVVDDADEKRAFIENWFPNIPAVDAAEVVRCMNCKHYIRHIISENVYQELCGSLGCFIPPYFFCANGERKEDSNAAD